MSFRFDYTLESGGTDALILGAYRIPAKLAIRLAGLNCSEPEKINAAVQTHYRTLLDGEHEPAKRARIYTEAYDTLAALYHGWGFSESGVSSSLREVIRHFFRGRDVVELGCGRAQLARQLADEVKSYRGIEVSEAYLSGGIDMADSRKHFEFQCASLLDANLGEGTADIIYSNDVIEHIGEPELEVMMQKAFRALRPGGLIVTLTPNRHFGPFDASRVFLKIGEPSAGLHIKEYGYADLRKIYDRAGFVSPRAFPFPLRVAEWCMRKLPLSVERLGVPSIAKELLEACLLTRRCFAKLAGVWIVFLWARKP